MFEKLWANSPELNEKKKWVEDFFFFLGFTLCKTEDK